jgi:hypothetical protein
MPSPITPNDLKELLNDTGGSFCDKFLRLLKGFPEAVYNILLYERNEDGTLTDAMEDDICALGCAGGGGGGGGGSSLSAPTSVSATDGTLGDRVRITWNVVVAATDYDIYRRDTATAEGSTLIGTTTSLTFDDTTAVADTVYYYWVKARNATLTSAFSTPDSGYISTELDAVTTLEATQGFSHQTGTKTVQLVWTPTLGATAWDIYRGATNVFADATKIDSDRVPFDGTASVLTGPTPTFIDNGDELVYFDAPAATESKWYYWVVGKRTSPTAAVSAESNSAQGWALGAADGATVIGQFLIPSQGPTATVPASAVRAWVVLFGNGGAGAGGNAAVGGGGGGGGAVCWGEIPVTPGDEFRITLSVPPAGNAAAATSGGAGAQTDLEYKPLAGAYSMIMRSSVAAGGAYAAAGGGAGGAGSTGSTSGVTNPQTRPGRSGEAGSGNRGGRGGHRFGFYRFPGAHFAGTSPSNYASDSGQSGGGSYAVASAPSLAVGGNNATTTSNVQANAIIIYLDA